MKTKIVTELNGTAEPGSFTDESGILSQVLEEPQKGFFRSTKLGRGGVQMKRGDICVVVPLDKLWALAIQIEPGLHPQTPKEIQPAETAVNL